MMTEHGITKEELLTWMEIYVSPDTEYDVTYHPNGQVAFMPSVETEDELNNDILGDC